VLASGAVLTERGQRPAHLLVNISAAHRLERRTLACGNSWEADAMAKPVATRPTMPPLNDTSEFHLLVIVGRVAAFF
jgi:hypothetical protein